MGLPTFARGYLKQKYAKAFSFERIGTPQVIIYDLMKDVKYLPKDVVTLHDFLKYLTGKIQAQLFADGVEACVVLVDRKPLAVKKAITHAKRYKKKNLLDANEGPYLPANVHEKIDLKGRPWIDFAGNYLLLQRELYPRLFNAFVSGEYITPRPGQRLFLHGFPGFCEYVYINSKYAHTLRTDSQGRREVLHVWRPDMELPITPKMEEEDPELYNRVFLVENVPICMEFPEGLMRREEQPQMRNDISEADAGMFFYDHWFQDKSIMFVCNDGDVFSYGLLYALERVTAQNVFRNIHYACLPYKLEKEDNDIFPNGKKPDDEYIDFNMFYIQVKEDYSMRLAGVQNHIATLVFLLILAESDYFKDYAKGLGKENIIWSVFRFNMSMFSHMVQLSKGYDGDTRTPRQFVIDEDCFRLFIHYCYVEKYGARIRNHLQKEEITYKDLENFTQTQLKNAQKDEEFKLPSRNKIRLWARQIDYNLHLYKNAHIGGSFAPNPFLLYEDKPFYPYSKTQGVLKYVNPKRPAVDEVYEQHFIKNKKAKMIDVSMANKKKIVETLGAKKQKK